MVKVVLKARQTVRERGGENDETTTGQETLRDEGLNFVGGGGDERSTDR